MKVTVTRPIRSSADTPTRGTRGRRIRTTADLPIKNPFAWIPRRSKPAPGIPKFRRRVPPNGILTDEFHP